MIKGSEMENKLLSVDDRVEKGELAGRANLRISVLYLALTEIIS
jgi:hypothetical protein